MLMFWDDPKRLSNIEDHGLDFAQARDRFEWESALVEDAHPGMDGRARYIAIGFLEGDLVSLVFSLLGTEARHSVTNTPSRRLAIKCDIVYARGMENEHVLSGLVRKR